MAGICGAAGTYARLLYSPIARHRQRRTRPRNPSLHPFTFFPIFTL